MLQQLLGMMMMMSLAAGAQVVLPGGDQVWLRHSIDASSEGADGVKLGDWNGDGQLDLVTGWEEGGLVRVYVNPGEAGVRAAWETLTVGRVKDVEEAIFTDLDVITCEERDQLGVIWYENPSRGKR
jgi:hypothetical protein